VLMHSILSVQVFVFFMGILVIPIIKFWMSILALVEYHIGYLLHIFMAFLP
jgi:hypothetical protein